MIHTMSWTKDSFLSLLLIYASNVDMEMTEAEHAWISRQFGEEAYQKAKNYYDDHSEYEAIQKVMSLKAEFLPNAGALATCRQHLAGIFAADGEFSRFEHDVMHVLEKLLK